MACIALIAWIAVRAVDMGAGRYLQRYRLDVEDNLLARKHITQMRVFKRITDTLIIMIATSAALMKGSISDRGSGPESSVRQALTPNKNFACEEREQTKYRQPSKGFSASESMRTH
jgi:hypothetical protein